MAIDVLADGQPADAGHRCSPWPERLAEHWSAARPGTRLLLSALTLGLAMVIAGATSRLVATGSGHAIVWWPAAGIAVAAVASSTRRSRQLLLAVIAAAGLGGYALAGYPAGWPAFWRWPG